MCLVVNSQTSENHQLFDHYTAEVQIAVENGSIDV